MSRLEIVIWNVSHGLAVTIVTPNRKLVACDAGRSEWFSPLTYLERLGWTQLDYFFLSHPHADHLRDIDALVRLRPKAIWRPKPPERQIREAATSALEEGIVDRYEEAFDRTYVHPTAESPLDPSWSGGCEFAVFVPPAHENLNNMSLVLFIGFGGWMICLPGDLEKDGWLALLEDPMYRTHLQHTTVLVAPHHGREAGVCREAFRYLSPELCVISDGPYSTTSSAVYSALASGAWVHKAGVGSWRQSLSTRKDGHIRLGVDRHSWMVEAGCETP